MPDKISSLFTSSLPRIVETMRFEKALSEYLIDRKVATVLLVTSPSMLNNGIVKRLSACLLDANSHITLDIISSISPNPELSDLQNTSQSYGVVDCIVALGGGSVIDSAKVLSRWLVAPETSFDDLLLQGEKEDTDSKQVHKHDIERTKIPLITVPSTSGTGSEVTPFATIWDSSTQTKYSLGAVLPSLAILDPSICLSLPRQETLYGGLDALSHCLESLWNKNATQQSIEYAYLGLEELLQGFNAALNISNKRVNNTNASSSDTKDELTARQHMQRGACLAGLAIASTKTAIAHALSYPITLHYKVPHGLACSFTLLSIMKHYGPADLGIDSAISNQVISLLSSLSLDKEIAKYTQGQSIVDTIELELDPSRAGNFSADISSKIIEQIMSDAQGEMHD